MEIGEVGDAYRFCHIALESKQRNSPGRLLQGVWNNSCKPEAQADVLKNRERMTRAKVSKIAKRM
jgi:hypothetical protein